MRLIQIGLPLLDYMGSCYGRSPPEGAGWEAAGRTSMPMENHGSVMPKETQLRSKGSTHRFTLWTIYVMMTRRVMTTFTILTTATTFTLWMNFQYHRQLRYIRSHAATKIDVLSGELLEDIEKNPLSNVDYPHGNLNNKKLEGISVCKDTSLRTRGGHNPNPLMRPKPAAQKRLASQSRRFSQVPKVTSNFVLLINQLQILFPQDFSYNWRLGMLKDSEKRQNTIKSLLFLTLSRFTF